MIALSAVDTILILTYFAAVVFVGFRSARKTSSAQEDYLLAGRSLTLPVFVMTLVSTWYGGILGVGEFTYRYGISNWLVMGVPYYVFAALFAVFLAKKIRATNLYTIPDKLHQAYGAKTALLGACLTFILMTPAPYVLMLSVFLEILFGWSMPVSIVVTAAVVLSYLYVGGFRSDVATDILEFVLMFGGFVVILPFAVHQFGGIEFLRENLPSFHLIWHGGHSAQFIFVWFFIALWTMIDPAFHQRCYAAKDGATAQKGVLLSILFWFLFDFMTAVAGLYARAALPHLEQPMMSYPMLAEVVLPPVAKGLFFIGMLATIMSTLNTLGFVSAQTLGRDIMMRFEARGNVIALPQLFGGRSNLISKGIASSEIQTPDDVISNHNVSDTSATKLTRLGLVISFLLSAALAFAIPSVVKIWYTIGTVVIPGLLVPLMASYFERLKISARYAFLAMLFGWLTSLGWLIAGNVFGSSGNYPFGIEPMYPGLAVSLLFWGIGRSQTLLRNAGR